MANTHAVVLASASSQYLSITDASQTGLDLTGNFTIEFWVKMTSQPSSGAGYAMVSKWESVAGKRSYVIEYFNDSGTLKIRSAISTDGSDANAHVGATDYTLTNGTWFHIAVTYDTTSEDMKLYVNGALQDTYATGLTSVFNSGSPFFIGATGDGTPANYADAQFDDVRVWSSERTADEIEDFYDKQILVQSGLEGYWRLNNDSTDETSNSNDLTQNGSPTFTTSGIQTLPTAFDIAVFSIGVSLLSETYTLTYVNSPDTFAIGVSFLPFQYDGITTSIDNDDLNEVTLKVET